MHLITVPCLVLQNTVERSEDVDKEVLPANDSSLLYRLVSVNRWIDEQVWPAQLLESLRNRIMSIRHR